MNKNIKAASQALADLINNRIASPARGCHAGDGIHVTIPGNFLARIAAAQDVPGCSYASLDFRGRLLLDERVQDFILNVNIPSLPAQYQAPATLLVAKLNAWLPADEDDPP